MKVLFVTSWFPTDTDLGGVFIKRHALALANEGVDITVLITRIQTGKGLFKKSTSSTKIEGLIIIEHTVKSKGWKFIYTLYPLLKWVFRKEIKQVCETNYDIVQSNVLHPVSIIGDAIASQLAVPHLVMEHHSKSAQYLDHLVFKRGLRNVLKKSKAVLFVSAFLKSTIVEKVPSINGIVIPNVVDSGEISRNESYVKSENRLRFLAIANWTKGKRAVKRPELIIEALGKLNREVDQDVEIEFIGGGDRIDELKKLAKEHELTSVFSLQQNSEYINDRLNNVDYFVHASTIETFSLVVVEALSVGTPVIASNVGAIPEHINTENGVLVENNVNSWYEGLKKLINTEYNRFNIAEEINGKYTPSVVAQKLIEVYQTVSSNSVKG